MDRDGCKKGERTQNTSGESARCLDAIKVNRGYYLIEVMGENSSGLRETNIALIASTNYSTPNKG